MSMQRKMKRAILRGSKWGKARKFVRESHTRIVPSARKVH